MKFYEDERVWESCDGEYQITQHKQGHFTAAVDYGSWNDIGDDRGEWRWKWNTLDEAREVCAWHKQQRDAE